MEQVKTGFVRDWTEEKSVSRGPSLFVALQPLSEKGEKAYCTTT
jgi:hypothetical protein